MSRSHTLAYVVLVLVSLAFALASFSKVCPAVISLNIMEDLHMDLATLPLISGAAMLGYALMQIPSGYIADIMGGRKVIILLTLMAGGGMLAFAFSPTPSLAIGSRFVTGLGLAITVPALTMLALWFPPQAFARANSIMLTCGVFGSMLASGPLAWATARVGWRVSLTVAAGVTLTLAFFLWQLIPEAVSQKEAVPPRSASKEPSPKAAHLGASLKVILQTRQFWLLAIWYVSFIALNLSFTSLWWGPFLMQGSGLSQTGAGSVLATIMILALPMLPLVAWCSDSLLHSRKRVLIILACISLAALPLMILACGTSKAWVHIAIGVIFYYGTAGGTGVIYASMRETFPVHMLGIALGCLNTCLPLASALWQKLFGRILQARMGVQQARPDQAYGETMLLLGLIMLAGLGAALLLKETYPGKHKQNHDLTASGDSGRDALIS